uniref:Uncharacterized protein n=1 Tax=Candidatus Methanogaster sp. ANME-2c ERB4 TaxID=2759911 RepID=A0A7G9Y954_9EURY|nr:hypothetical protein CBGFFKFA_00004 [Methanosarcinales archaeon ANME-2c ERB4]QNO49665.1 hypothetical protein FBMMOPGC_00012 [Methanosarcinales archaeon ANME-2c ERB4]QNO50102.1 hypothetical protein GDOAKEED_00006 [Methanosarcinales archaeon ANME-2c ERB4]
MDKEESIKIIRDEVSKEFGAERMKEIEYFGPYEDEDLDVIVYVEGIDDRKDTVGVGMRLFDMFLEMGLDVPLRIVRAKEWMGEGAAE